MKTFEDLDNPKATIENFGLENCTNTLDFRRSQRRFGLETYEEICKMITAVTTFKEGLDLYGQRFWIVLQIMQTNKLNLWCMQKTVNI